MASLTITTLPKSSDEEGSGYKKETSDYANLYPLVATALVIMNSNAESERVFSLQTDTIAPKRSRLDVEHLKQGIHVAMGCKSEALPLANFTRRTFDWDEKVFVEWTKLRPRRPGAMRTVAKVCFFSCGEQNLLFPVQSLLLH